MESKILKAIGLANIDPAYIIIVLLLVIVALLVLIIMQTKNKKRIEQMEYRLKRLCSGKDGESLEEELAKLFEDNEYMMTTVNQHKTNIRNIYRRLEKSYQKMSLVKYDAFNQMGGQLSFVLVVLDENNNGFLINSVHSLNGNYCYSKEIVNGTCEIELGDEEFEALTQAKEVELQLMK
ncbi:MAG: DUF4446 family protein [Lachnospiraceae bacterium]|nr:DUF4446 family protein [Lachnospiraceae bacterium]